MTAMTKIAEKTKRQPVDMNGVDTPKLMATINAVAGQPELANFEFRASNKWIAGTRSQSKMHGFFGAGGEHKHIVPYMADGDHPAVLCGADSGTTPVEWILHALATCLTAGIGNIAAVRGIRLSRVESRVTGEIDLRGILGISKDVRNGYQDMSVTIEIEGDASPEDLEKIVMQAKARSAVYDILTNGVPVAVCTKMPAMA